MRTTPPTLPFSNDRLTLNEALTLCEQLRLGLGTRLSFYSPDEIRRETPPVALAARVTMQVDTERNGILVAPQPNFIPAKVGLITSSLSPRHLEGLGAWELDPTQAITYELGPAWAEFFEDDEAASPTTERDTPTTSFE